MKVAHPLVYLCGPIHGRTDEQCITWRQRFKTMWPGDCLDPMRRDYRGREYEDPHGLITADLFDVDDCDAVLVYFDAPSVGTSMEVFYAKHNCGKRVVVINASTMNVLPVWLVYHADSVVTSMEDAIGALCIDNDGAPYSCA